MDARTLLSQQLSLCFAWFMPSVVDEFDVGQSQELVAMSLSMLRVVHV